MNLHHADLIIKPAKRTLKGRWKFRPPRQEPGQSSCYSIPQAFPSCLQATRDPSPFCSHHLEFVLLTVEDPVKHPKASAMEPKTVVPPSPSCHIHSAYYWGQGRGSQGLLQGLSVQTALPQAEDVKVAKERGSEGRKLGAGGNPFSVSLDEARHGVPWSL